jgi:hypothetical protein
MAHAKGSNAETRKASALVAAIEQDDLYERLSDAEGRYEALRVVMRTLGDEERHRDGRAEGDGALMKDTRLNHQDPPLRAGKRFLGEDCLTEGVGHCGRSRRATLTVADATRVEQACYASERARRSSGPS